MTESSLAYRKDRMASLAKSWKAGTQNPLFVEWKIPPELFEELKMSIGVYVARACGFAYTDNEETFMKRLDANRGNRRNVTPNGGVVPKREFQLEYNLFLRSWCRIVSKLIEPNPKLLKKFRVTPNIRIKFAQELEENVGRSLDTALPHSDAWVEGPWGMNCHLPVLGDTDHNFLQFFKLKNDLNFEDRFLTTAATYTEMKWVLDYYQIDPSIKPQRGYVSISDYALVHNTQRDANCGSRISIDTTIFAGDHDVHPDREAEYLDYVPIVGEDLFVASTRSEREDPLEKKSTFSHYTTGSLKRIPLV